MSDATDTTDAESSAMVSDYITQKRQGLDDDNSSLDTLSKSDSSSQVSSSVATTASDNTLSRLGNSPLSQLGNDYISQQISKNGTALINNVSSVVGKTIFQPVADAQNLVFNAIAVAMTAQNDMVLYFMQQVANNAIAQLEKKKAVLLVLQEKLRLLYNALVQLTAGDPFFNKYLIQLRQALSLIFAARTETTNVRNTLAVTNRWLAIQFKEATDTLKQAEALLQPPGQTPATSYTQPGLLSGVGITPPNQQLQLILAIPQLVQEVFAAATGYFTANAAADALLLAFIQGYGQLQTASSDKLTAYSISTLDNLVSQMDGIISDMANQLNGTPDAILVPSPGFVPASVKVSASALKWLLQLKTIIEYATFVPGPTLAALTVSNDALARYQAAVVAIEAKGNRTTGAAVLTATQGREDIGELEAQITTFCLSALQSIVDAKASANILALGRTLQTRCTLSLEQDAEIEVILKRFASAPLAAQSALNAVGSSIFKMMNDMGLDRASSLLKGGKFSEFFNLNSKTATFAGAALVGIAKLKECLTTDEDRQQLTQAERVIQRDNKAKQLLAQRTASTGIAAQKAANTAEDKQLQGIQQQANQASQKCGVPSDLASPNLLKNLGGVLGVGILGGNTLSPSLAKYGKGIL